MGKLTPEVKQAIELLKNISSKFEEYDRTVVDNYAKDAIKSFKKKKSFRDSLMEVVDKGGAVEDYIITYIYRRASIILESGEHHIYRGVLGPSGEPYKRIFERGVDLLVEGGYVTKEVADQNIRKRVYRNMETVG